MTGTIVRVLMILGPLLAVATVAYLGASDPRYRGPVPILIGLGALLILAVYLFSTVGASNREGVYRPSEVVNGELVPGRVE